MRSYNRILQGEPRHSIKWVTPVDRKLSTIVHPLHLGTSSRDLKVVSGPSFVMHNLVTGPDHFTVLKPVDLLTEFVDRTDPLIREVQTLSRSVRSVSKKHG